VYHSRKNSFTALEREGKRRERFGCREVVSTRLAAGSLSAAPCRRLGWNCLLVRSPSFIMAWSWNEFSRYEGDTVLLHIFNRLSPLLHICSSINVARQGLVCTRKGSWLGSLMLHYRPSRQLPLDVYLVGIGTRTLICFCPDRRLIGMVHAGLSCEFRCKKSEVPSFGPGKYISVAAPVSRFRNAKRGMHAYYARCP